MAAEANRSPGPVTGEFVRTATATDLAGNSTRVSVTFTIFPTSSRVAGLLESMIGPQQPGNGNGLYQNTANGLYQDLMAIAKLIARGGHCDVEESKASFRRHDENYGTASDLKAWCEDGVQLADVLAANAPNDSDALHREAMHYLCRTVYGYARRFLPSRHERMKAYRMIDGEFGHCYPYMRYLYDESVLRRYRKVRNSARRLVTA